MALFTHVADDDTREPIQGISVVLTDTAGKNLIDPVITDWDGSFTLPEEPFKNSAGKKLKFSGSGYETKIIDASNISYDTIFLTPLSVSKDNLGQNLKDRPVEIKKDYSLAYIFGGTAVFCFVMAIVIKK